MGRWSDEHDQRVGQWIYNCLREFDGSGVLSPMEKRSIIADKLFNMDNEEFFTILRLGKFHKSVYKSIQGVSKE